MVDLQTEPALNDLVKAAKVPRKNGSFRGKKHRHTHKTFLLLTFSEEVPEKSRDRLVKAAPPPQHTPP